MELLLGIGAGLVLGALQQWVFALRARRRRRRLSARTVPWWTTPVQQRNALERRSWPRSPRRWS